MGVLGDMMTMKPSDTGKDSMTLDEMGSLLPGTNWKGPKDKSGRPIEKGDPWGEYLKTMQYLTQPKTDAGPEARRAMMGMHAGPQNTQDPVQLQKPGMGASLMSLLFGGGLK